MKAKDAVVCGKCGALNRATWPFCARCNESLEGAQPSEEPAPRGQAAGDQERGLPFNKTAILLLLAVVGSGAWAWHSLTHPPAPGPDPGLFTIGTLATELPSPAPRTAPGLAEYDAARAALAKGDTDGALRGLAAAVAADPGNAQYHNAYAYGLWKSGDRERALQEQAQAARLDPRLQVSHARMLDSAGRTEEASIAYETVLAQMPDAGTVHQELGRIALRTGDFAKAARHLQQAAAQSSDPVLQQELAYALDQTGDRARASAVYREILERAPTATATRQYLSENLYQQGQKDEALALLKEGIAGSPDKPSLHLQLGRLLALEGRSSEAVAAYKRYLEMAPNAPDAKDIAARAAALERLARAK